jgi:hypothetical protein
LILTSCRAVLKPSPRMPRRPARRPCRGARVFCSCHFFSISASSALRCRRRAVEPPAPWRARLRRAWLVGEQCLALGAAIGLSGDRPEDRASTPTVTAYALRAVNSSANSPVTRERVRVDAEPLLVLRAHP